MESNTWSMYLCKQTIASHRPDLRKQQEPQPSATAAHTHIHTHTPVPSPQSARDREWPPTRDGQTREILHDALLTVSGCTPGTSSILFFKVIDRPAVLFPSSSRLQVFPLPPGLAGLFSEATKTPPHVLSLSPIFSVSLFFFFSD